MKKIKKSTVVCMVVATICIAVFYASLNQLGSMYFTGSANVETALNTAAKANETMSSPLVPAYQYLLKEHNEKIGIFSWETEKLIRETEVYVYTLPQYDQLQLKSGIKLKDDAELRKILEDFE